MAVIRGKNRRGRAAQIVIYDLQGGELPKEFLDGLEDALNTFLGESAFGKTVAITVNVE